MKYHMITEKTAYLYKLECNQFESFLLESLDDFADKTTLDTVRLDHQIGSLKKSRFPAILHKSVG